MVDRSLLVKMIGFPAVLVHGDTFILDRWLWVKSLLPKTRNGEKLMDVGCGSGAFTIGAALRGYESTGVNWNERELEAGKRRAKICKADLAKVRIRRHQESGSHEPFHGKIRRCDML